MKHFVSSVIIVSGLLIWIIGGGNLALRWRGRRWLSFADWRALGWWQRLELFALLIAALAIETVGYLLATSSMKR
jgi:hypothetical protein